MIWEDQMGPKNVQWYETLYISVNISEVLKGFIFLHEKKEKKYLSQKISNFFSKVIQVIVIPK